MNASMSSSPRSSASSNSSAASAEVIVSGFSQSTCLPASSPLRAHSRWSPLGNEM